MLAERLAKWPRTWATTPDAVRIDGVRRLLSVVAERALIGYLLTCA